LYKIEEEAGNVDIDQAENGGSNSALS